MKVLVSPSILSGSIIAPPSKSHTLRALFFAAFANSFSQIHHPLDCEDSIVMMNCLKLLGADFDQSKETLVVFPIKNFKLKKPITLNVGNSGIAFRFLTAITPLFDGTITIDGDESIRQRRPIKPLTLALNQLGLDATFFDHQKNAPLMINGSIKNFFASIESADSQPITALFYLASLTKKAFDIRYFGCEERPWLNLSYEWLEFLKLPVLKSDDHFSIRAHQGYPGFSYEVPGDWSAIAFFIAASVIHKKEMTIERVHLFDSQPDKAILKIFEKIGGTFIFDDLKHELHLFPPQEPMGFEFDLEQGIDLLPILASLACFLNSKTHLYNGKIARKKESDRIESIAKELKKMGAKIETFEDSLTIYPSMLEGANLFSHLDHRIAMALTISATKAIGPTTIEGANCVNKTFPKFFQVMKNIQGKIVIL